MREGWSPGPKREDLVLAVVVDIAGTDAKTALEVGPQREATDEGTGLPSHMPNQSAGSNPGHRGIKRRGWCLTPLKIRALTLLKLQG